MENIVQVYIFKISECGGEMLWTFRFNPNLQQHMKLKTNKGTKKEKKIEAQRRKACVPFDLRS